VAVARAVPVAPATAAAPPAVMPPTAAPAPAAPPTVAAVAAPVAVTVATVPDPTPALTNLVRLNYGRKEGERTIPRKCR
jgi:hypothetical protein